MGTVRCGNCGALVELPKTSSFGMGFNISKESAGDYVLKMEKENNNMTDIFTTNDVTNNNSNVKENKRMTKQEQMIELLKANGFNMNDFFSAMRNSNVSEISKEDIANDPIAQSIVEDGDVFNGRLDGRWIMAQMFHMLNYNSGYGKGYNDALNNKGYMYQWDFLLGRNHGEETGELVRLMKREKDKEDVGIKQIWFDGNLIGNMINDYCEKLSKYIDKLPTFMCKKTLPYKRLGGRYEKVIGNRNGDIFVDDLPKLYATYKQYAYRARKCGNYRQLCNVVRDFRRSIILPQTHSKINKYFDMSQAFKDAYKGNGAYYTAANMIRFHKCLVRGCSTKEESMKVLNQRAVEGYGWKLLGFLKELIDDNKFDFDARMKELNI